MEIKIEQITCKLRIQEGSHWEEIVEALSIYYPNDDFITVGVVFKNKAQYEIVKDLFVIRGNQEYQLLQNDTLQWSGFISEMPIIDDSLFPVLGEICFVCDAKPIGNLWNFKQVHSKTWWTKIMEFFHYNKPKKPNND